MSLHNNSVSPVEVPGNEEEEQSIQDLVDTLRSNDGATVQEVVVKLNHLIDGLNPNWQLNCQELFDAGGHVKVLECIKTSFNDANGADLLRHCFAMLTYLTYSSMERQYYFAKRPVIEFCKQAVTKFPKNAGVCGSACCLLRNLCVVKNIDFSRAIVESGTIPLVLEIMKRFLKDEFAQECGCGLLFNLLQMDDIEIGNAIARADGLSIVGTTKEHFRKNQVIQQDAYHCIAFLNEI